MRVWGSSMPGEDIAHVKLHAMEDLVQAVAAPRRQSADAGEVRKIRRAPRFLRKAPNV